MGVQGACACVSAAASTLPAPLVSLAQAPAHCKQPLHASLSSAGGPLHCLLSAPDVCYLVLQQAERCGAERLIIIAPDEWERGLVRVKDLAAREEQDVAVDAILPEQ